jgi:hypothetical protein
VWVDNPRPAGETGDILAHFGERILLRDDVQVEAGEEGWDVRLTWQAVRPVGINYTLSLHLLSLEGDSLAQRDWAEGPGYGFLPTSVWPVGEWLTDRLRVPIPAGVRAQEAAALRVVLYDRSQPGYPAVGQAVAPLVAQPRRYDLPEVEHEVGALFGDQILLLGYDLARERDLLRLTLAWQAQRDVTVDGVVFCHLYDPASERIMVQSDARPVKGTYPTLWWREGEVVRDEILLPLTGVPSGAYRLGVVMYTEPDDRLPVSGSAAAGGRLVLDDVVEVD